MLIIFLTPDIFKNEIRMKYNQEISFKRIAIGKTIKSSSIKRIWFK